MTANQAMLAVHAAELTSVAESNHAKIGWEAAVGGGIPCIRALREGCAANPNPNPHPSPSPSP